MWIRKFISYCFCFLLGEDLNLHLSEYHEHYLKDLYMIESENNKRFKNKRVYLDLIFDK